MRTLILAAVLVIGGCIQHQHLNAKPAPKMESVDVLAFTAPWCGPCRRNAPHLTWLMGEGLKVTWINIDLHPARADKYHIKTIPTYVVRKNGREVWRTNNVRELDKLVQ